MCCGGINDLGAQATRATGQTVDHCHGFNRSFVVQAQNHQVRLSHKFPLCLGILAQFRRDTEQFDLHQTPQTFADLQTRGTGFAIDKYFLHAVLCGCMGVELQTALPVRLAQDLCVAT